MTLLSASRRYLGELGADLWDATAAASLETAKQHVHHNALLSRLAQLAPTSVWPSWFQQRSTPPSFSAWCGESCTRLLSWLEQQSSMDLKAWWAVGWVRVGAMALFLGMLQGAFVLVRKSFRAAAGFDVGVDDGRCPDAPRHFQDSSGTASTLVGTFHGSDGSVCQLDLGKLGLPEEPAAFERKKRGVLGAAWGSGRSKQTDDVSGAIQVEADEFSSMFRALSQASCSVTGFADEGEGSGGATSSVVVVTQQTW